MYYFDFVSIFKSNLRDDTFEMEAPTDETSKNRNDLSLYNGNTPLLFRTMGKRCTNSHGETENRRKPYVVG